MKTLCILAATVAAVTAGVPSALAAVTPASSGGISIPGISPGTPETLPEPPPLETYLGNGRFRLLADFETVTGAGNAVPRSLTADTASFWFFRPDNLELMVKVLDGCPLNQRFWVFAAGLTNVGVELTVEDTVAGVTRPYSNQPGTAFAPVQDAGAFATCDQQRACGRGTAEEIAATPREHFNIEWLALATGRRLTAAAHYDRMVADLAAIHALAPETEGMLFVGRWEPYAVTVEFERAIYDAIAAGTYHAWDCLNDWYGVRDVDLVPEPTATSGSVEVTFGGFLHPYLVGPDYAALPGALGFAPFTFPPDIIIDPVPPPPQLCARLDGEAIHYYFNDETMLWHAVSPAPGQVPTEVEEFDLMLPTLPPPWVEDLEECRLTYQPS